MIAPLSRFIRRFRRDASGVSAVEFAFIAPVMIIFYFGLAEYTQALIAQRRTIGTASAIGDLVAQASGSTRASDVDDIMSMSNVLMAPFPVSGTNLKVCVTSIVADASNNKKVAWRRQKNDTSCPAVNSTVSGLSSNIIGASQSLIMAKVTYSYSSTTNQILKTNPTFTKTYYLRPRRSTTITCSDC